MSNRDIMSPSVLTCAGYVAAVASCIYNTDTWGVSVGSYTMIVITIGLCSFIVGELFVTHGGNGKSFDTEIEHGRYKRLNDVIRIPLWFTLFVIIIDVIIIYKYNSEILRIAAAYGFADKYGTAWAYRNGLQEDSVNTIIVQLSRITINFGYVYLFIIINNFFRKEQHSLLEWVKEELFFIIPIVLALYLSFMKAGRLVAISMMVYTVFLVYFFWRKKVGWNRRLPLKVIMIYPLVIVGFLFFFYSIKEFVGRANVTQTFVYYITRYIGGSIQCFDQFLYNGSGNMGNPPFSESLTGVVRSLNKIGLTSIQYNNLFDFVYSNGCPVGNVFTNLRRFYNDFGIMGVIVFQFVFSLIFNNLYWKAKKMEYFTPGKLFNIVLYGSWVYLVIIQAMEDQFFRNISIGWFIDIIILRLIIYFMFQFRAKIR
jgi:oligosaccharide repeat unit polymerase